jgi:DNA polymerase
MDRPPPPSSTPTLADQFAAALDWWREAGVDADYRDEPASLLDVTSGAEAAPPAPTVTKPRTEAVAPPPPPPTMGGDRSGWPTTLAEFAAWWLIEPTLGDGPVAARVPPRLVDKTELLLLIPMPEAEDGAQLLSGKHGVLIANMLRAMGIAPQAASIAAALPSHMPAADWETLRQQGLGEVLRHLVTLVAPRRVLVLGQDVLPLLDLEKRQGVRELPLVDARVPLLASLAPDILLGNARSRADLWRRWLDWTETA